MPSRFAAATRGTVAALRLTTGTRIGYQDSLAATTSLRVFRCAGAAARPCSRLRVVGSFSHGDHAGTNALRFTGRLHGAALKPGRYLLRATARLQGQQSTPLTARFTVVPPPTGRRAR